MSWGDGSEILAVDAALEQRERPNGPGSLRMKSGASKKVAMWGSKRARSSDTNSLVIGICFTPADQQPPMV